MALKLCMQLQPPDDDLQECIDKEVNERLVQNMRDSAGTAGNIVGLFLAGFVGRLLRAQEQMVASPQHAIFIFVGVVLVVMRTLPRLVNIRTLHFWNGLLMLMLCFVVASFDGRMVAYPVFSVTMSVPRYALSTMYCNLPASIFWNMAYFAATVRAHSRNVDESSDDLRNAELALTIFLVLIVAQQRQAMWREARQKVEIKKFSGERSAMTDLLTLACDVVLELDPELRITEHSLKLSAMLILDRSSCTAGMQLQQFMPAQEDRERFDTHLGGSSEAEDEHRQPPPRSACSSGAFHATMRDSMNSKLQVEIFFVRFHGVSGRRQFLVGIREFAEQPLAELKRFSRQPSPPSPDQETQDHALDAADAAAAAPPADADDTGDSENDNDDVEAASSFQSSCACSETPSTRAAGPRLVLSQFLPTRNRAKAVTLVEAMQQWNFDVAADVCCPFHAAVQDVRKCCSRMRHSRCKRNFLPAGNMQCKSCGILIDSDDVADGAAADAVACDTCGAVAAIVRARVASL